MSRTEDILARLVAFDTVMDRQTPDLIAYSEALLQAAGFRTTRLPATTGPGVGLFAQRGQGDGGVALSAHADVVSTAGQDWQTDPFTLTRRGDRLHGRGTTDMKGFLAAMLALAERAPKNGAPLKLVISYAEEVGCVGIQDMRPVLAPLLGRPRAVLVGEPTGLALAIGHKGKAAYRITCTGTPGHPANAPLFDNALHVAADVILAIRGLQAEVAKKGSRDAAYTVPHATLHVGKLTGGSALNMVPQEAAIEMEIRHLATEPLEALETRLRTALDTIATQAGPDTQITVTKTSAYPGLDVTDQALIAWGKTIASTSEITKVAFGTEAGVFAEMGLNAIVCGPGDMDADGHKPNESIAVAALGACDRTLDRVVSQLG